MPSYKHSTLAMMLVSTTASIFVLIILALVMAICFPKAYELVSQKEFLVIILVWAYILVWNNIWSAYLTQRWAKNNIDLNQAPDNKLNEPQDILSNVSKQNLHDVNDIQDVW